MLDVGPVGESCCKTRGYVGYIAANPTVKGSDYFRLTSCTTSGLTGILCSTQVLGSAINPGKDTGEKIEILVSPNVCIGDLKKKLEKKFAFYSPLMSPVNMRKYRISSLEKDFKGYSIRRNFMRPFIFVLQNSMNET